MSPFARILNRLMGAPEAARDSAFEDAVAMFDAHVAATLAQPERAPWAEELGVAWPCSAAELRRAFRKRAFETHPDRPGGSHEAFLRVQSLLERALAELAAQGEPKRLSAASRYTTSPAPVRARPPSAAGSALYG